MNRTIKQRDDGDMEEIWSVIAEVWARIVPLRNDLSIGEGWEKEPSYPIKGRYHVLMRFRPTNFKRLEWREKTLKLFSEPIADEDRCFIECLAYEV
ncbi:MAG: hypothetical protein HYS39_00690 [Proteobacteria bacterium]|nr:hypothetical protein [Pseudomonadota bacterium]